MTVNSESLTPWPITQIMKAMSECKIKLNEKSPAKKQALEIIKELEKIIPIKRA